MAGDDIAMNQFQIVSDAPYVYVELADGSQGKIKKSDLVEVIRAAMPVATMEEKGMASAGQGIVEYRIVGEGSVDIPLPYYGIFLFVSEELVGSSLLFHLSYYKKDFKAVIDSSNIVGNLFNIEQLKDGSKTIRVTNLRSSVQFALLKLDSGLSFMFLCRVLCPLNMQCYGREARYSDEPVPSGDRCRIHLWRNSEWQPGED